MSQWEGLFHPIYEMENNPAMFETTNQILLGHQILAILGGPKSPCWAGLILGGQKMPGPLKRLTL